MNLSMSWLEIVSNAFSLLGVFLATRNRVETWPVGIIGCTLYGALFYEAKLYADVTLQGFFVLASVYGWYHWVRGGKDRTELPVTRVRPARLLAYSLAAVAVTGGYGALLHTYTDASYPFIDSIVLTFSVLAQLLLMARVLENWHVWVLVNVVAVPLYASKQLHLTAFVYFLFLINAFLGMREWRRVLARQALRDPA